MCRKRPACTCFWPPGELPTTNVPINDGRFLFNKITNINAKNVWILIQRRRRSAVQRSTADWGWCGVVAAMSSSPHLLTACDLLHSSTDLAQLSIIIYTNLHSLPQESCRQESSCGWCWQRPGWSAVWPPASTSPPSASPPSHSCWELSWWFYTKLTFDQISWLGLPGLSNSSQNSSIGNPYSKDFLHALNVKAEPRIPYSAVVII